MLRQLGMSQVSGHTGGEIQAPGQRKQYCWNVSATLTAEAACRLASGPVTAVQALPEPLAPVGA